MQLFDVAAKPITQFTGAYRFMSNFASVPHYVWYGERFYPTLEHAYQASKTCNETHQEYIRSASTPGIAKRRGQEVEIRVGWSVIRVGLMRELLAQKFRATSDLARELIATYPHKLVEGNQWHDQFWGDCFCGCEGCAEPGQNHLGRLLMERRLFILTRC